MNNCQKFIGRVEEDHPILVSFFSTYEGPIDDFLILRRSLWPDAQFYHPDLSRQRMQIAAMACLDQAISKRKPSAVCRSVLGLENGTAQNNLNFRVCTKSAYELFRGLAMRIGIAVERSTAEEWHALTRDVLRNFAGIRDLSRSRFPEHFASTKMTPLQSLIWEGIDERAAPYRKRDTMRPVQTATVLEGCENSIIAWLVDLYESGIDLQLYGKNEKENFRRAAAQGSKTTFKYHWFHAVTCVDTLYTVQLINFQYGRLPTDWKFWWSEPSDEFAGDFWLLVESGRQEAVMNIPGAWVD